MTGKDIGTLLLIIPILALIIFGMVQCSKDHEFVGHTWYCPQLHQNVQVISMNRRMYPTTYLCRYWVGEGPTLRLVEVTLTRSELTTEIEP